jgi:peroxiredoxin Q/BCP
MRKGDVVPDFELPDQTGTPRKLSDLLAGGPVVLFFYPAAMTYGCTKESCHFRDLGAEFAAVGAQRVGISADSVDKQKQFDEKESLGYPLLSDADRTVATQLGAKRGSSFLPNKRITFVIDTDRTLLDVIHTEFSMGAHADKALEILKARQAACPSPRRPTGHPFLASRPTPSRSLSAPRPRHPASPGRRGPQLESHSALIATPGSSRVHPRDTRSLPFRRVPFRLRR